MKRRWFTVVLAGLLLIGIVPQARAQTVSHGQYVGPYLLCDDGYRNVGRQCVAQPPVSHGQYVGPYLLCDNGYRNVGGNCAALPAVSGGQYVGSYLLCDNGYRNVTGRCEALPAVSNGQYIGSYLLCNDGYLQTGGVCQAAPPLANGTYFGGMVVCNLGFVFTSGQCQPGRSSQPASELRFDPALLAASRRAPSVDLKDVSYVESLRSVTTTSGTTIDPTSGNTYFWRRSSDGTTRVQGMNANTGSMWNTDIKSNGSMSGWDSKSNPWNYDSKSGLYINYGTGKMCVGTGLARTCF